MQHFIFKKVSFTKLGQVELTLLALIKMRNESDEISGVDSVEEMPWYIPARNNES